MHNIMKWSDMQTFNGRHVCTGVVYSVLTAYALHCLFVCKKVIYTGNTTYMSEVLCCFSP